MKSIIRIGVVFLLSGISLPVLAAEAHWYVGGGLHFFSIDQASTTFHQPSEEGLLGEPARDHRFRSRIDGGVTPSLLVGWDAPGYGIRAELEYRRYKSDVKRFGNEDTGQLFHGDAKAQQLIAMAWYDFRDIGFMPEGLTPYLGLGVGAAEVQLDGESDTGVIVQFGAGISYDFMRVFSADLGYRHFLTQDLNYEISSGRVTTKYSGDAVVLGLRWYWSR